MNGIALVVVAALLWGVGSFVSKVAVTAIGPWTAALVRSIVFFPLVAGFVLWRRQPSLERNRGLVYGALAGAVLGVGIVATRFSLSFYDVSLVDPIRRLNVLVAVLLSVLVLDEALTVRKGLGIATAIAALYLLTP
jgi:transporter family protein